MILGINAYHGDAAAAVLDSDGKLVAAVEEERFTRIKHCAGFPREAIAACLRIAGIEGKDISAIGISRDPRANLVQKILFAIRQRPSPRLLWSRMRNARRALDPTPALADALRITPGEAIRKLSAVEHHAAHLASAFFVSSFDEAACCAIDGFGDFVSTSEGIGRGDRLTITRRTYFPHSLGVVYLALTQFLGFVKYGDEFKVMGLAAYGKPEYADRMRGLIRLLPGGDFQIDLKCFRHWSDGVRMTWDEGEPIIEDVFTPKLVDLLGPRREPHEVLTERHAALAASLQLVFEEATVHVLEGVHRRTRVDRLCLAGGCAMNSVMNGRIRERTGFKEVYIQPASADDGTALGAALYVAHQLLERPRSFVMDHAYWGPEFEDTVIAAVLREHDTALRQACCVIHRELNEDELARWAAQRLADGRIVGWFDGRMEWGARALGNRSILADPRRSDMRDIINTKIKFREVFRPFAPSILEEALDEYFVGAVADPFMVQVYPVRPEKRNMIPAVTHADGTGRLQTVARRSNRRYWELLRAFEKLTGVPVLLNTSFNENEPIVHRPEEALDCFLRTRMDALVMGSFAIERPVRG